MDNTEQLISIYHTGFIVCAILLVVGIAMAVLFFFMFDIRNIFMLRTGRAKQQTIAEMQERNLQTGRLSAESPYTDSGELKSREKKRNTGAFRIPGGKKTVVEPPGSKPLNREILQTEPIGPSAVAASAVQTPAYVAGAAPAQNTAAETSLLGGQTPADAAYTDGRPREPQATERFADAAGAAANAAFVQQPAAAAPDGAAPGGPAYYGSGETEVLSDVRRDSMAASAARDFRFEITERVIVTHTTETIV